MAISLYPQQVEAIQAADEFYSKGHNNVLIVLPTGVGKTLVKAYYAHRYFLEGKVTLIFAHRDVLLGQISRACCLMGVTHSFICAEKTVGQITNDNHAEFGDNYHSEHSNVFVVSVDTFLARLKKGLISKQFLDRVGAWMIDEAHHLTRGSKWGQCIEALPNAKGLGVTATPIRGDRKGLGFDFDGYFHAMTYTSTMLDSIKSGRLTPYKIFAPTAIDVTGVKKDSDGDYNKNELYIRTKKANITGSAVSHYQKHLSGKPVITFCVNIEHCHDVAKEFNDAGIPSRVVSSKSLDSERKQAVADLRAGRLLNLVNCDLFGEGFDAPAVMGVIMLRRTESYSLFKQQFGRMLRVAEGKVLGILLDHVGNTQFFMQKYKLSYPHDDPKWSLARPDNRKRKEEDEDENVNTTPVETIRCGQCGAMGTVRPAEYVRTPDDISKIFYEGKCPECGWVESEQESETRRTQLKVVEGNLNELSFDIVETLIHERNRAMMPVADFRRSLGSAPFVHAAMHQHANRQHALSILRHWIQQWCLMHSDRTKQSVKLVQLDFEIKFGINVLKAQAESASKMTELAARIETDIQKMRVTS